MGAIPWIIGAVVTVGLFKTGTSAVEDVGQAVDSTGSGAVKLVFVAGASYLMLKKLKVV